MPKTLQEILSNAVHTGEMIPIIYHGGSQPGTVREISPVSISGTEVRARDGFTDTIKVYHLSKIEIPSKVANASDYDPDTKTAEDLRTIKEVFESRVGEFEAMGWTVKLSDNEIDLHYSFKDGKSWKGATLLLRFSEFIVDSVLDEEKWLKDDIEEFIDEKRKSKRPYHVASPTYQGSGFATLCTWE